MLKQRIQNTSKELATKEVRRRLTMFMKEQQDVKQGAVTMLDMGSEPCLYKYAVCDDEDIDVRLDERRVVVSLACIKKDNRQCQLHYAVRRIHPF